MPMPASTIRTPAGSGPPNSAEMAEKEPAVASTAFSRSPELHDPGCRDSDHRAERDQRGLRAEHEPEGERADRGQSDARAGRERRRRHAQPAQWIVAAIARQEAPRDDHDQPAHERDPEDQEPGRARVAERVREVVPEDVLELVHERQEAGGQQGRRHPQRSADQDQAQVGRTGQRLLLWRHGSDRNALGGSIRPPCLACRAPPGARSPARSRASSGSRARRTWRSPGRPCPRSPRARARTPRRRPRAACCRAPS